jgi:hypothetical protein
VWLFCRFCFNDGDGEVLMAERSGTPTDAVAR